MKREIKVGIFVLIGLLLVTVAIFMIGQNEYFWERKSTFYVQFYDVAGLKAGSPVQLGGVDVGTISRVGHSRDAGDTHIHVTLSIVRAEAVRVRKGTIAEVVNKGLLGDKMIELHVPHPEAPELASGGELVAKEPLDLTTYLTKFDTLVDKADHTLDNLEIASRNIADPELALELKGTIKSVHAILAGVADNDSAVHRLLMDGREGEKLDRLLSDIDHATSDVHGVMADVRDMTGQVKSGPGLAHALIYDGDVSKSAAGAIDELHKDLLAVREGNGLARALIYGDGPGGADQQHMMKNLALTTEDIRTIVANIRAGKGTLGALLVDPSLYEDLRATVGNMQRSEVLRALVRYTIKKDEEQPKKPAEAPSIKE
jgi:phospholipid/cholesterol/gamma-HCH transport system substrate-binding protein